MCEGLGYRGEKGSSRQTSPARVGREVLCTATHGVVDEEEDSEESGGTDRARPEDSLDESVRASGRGRSTTRTEAFFGGCERLCAEANAGGAGARLLGVWRNEQAEREAERAFSFIWFASGRSADDRAVEGVVDVCIGRSGGWSAHEPQRLAGRKRLTKWGQGRAV